MKRKLNTQQKQERIYLRVTPERKKVIAKAAKLEQKNISNFVLENAYQTAERLVSDQVHFKLNDEQWERFCEVLEFPVKEIPELRKLLSEPSVFEE